MGPGILIWGIPVKAVVRWELDLESMASFNRTCLHRIRKCYLGAKIEASVIDVG